VVDVSGEFVSPYESMCMYVYVSCSCRYHWVASKRNVHHIICESPTYRNVITGVHCVHYFIEIIIYFDLLLFLLCLLLQLLPAYCYMPISLWICTTPPYTIIKYFDCWDGCWCLILLTFTVLSLISSTV
jgi:hypothetical protein